MARRFKPGTKILIADDEFPIRMILGAMLEKDGAKVFLVADGIEAQSKLSEQHKLDLFITDNSMPRMSGTEVVKWMKDTANQQLPVIMHTSDRVKLDGVTMVYKPASPDEILRAIQKEIPHCFEEPPTQEAVV